MSKVKKFVENQAFQNFILGVIVFNCVLMGLQTSAVLTAKCGDLLNLLDNICLGIFIVELGLKIIAYNKNFLKDGWNIFDTIIVLMSLFSSMAFLSSLRIFRIFRVFRSLKALKSFRGFRMISSLKKLQVIIMAIVKSLPSIAWTGGLLLLVYYIFALMGVSFFGAAFPEWFGYLGKTMYTLFQVMTLESWSMGIARPVMEAYPAAWLYFVPFVLISSFIVMNVVVGIVVNAISDVTANDKQEEIKDSAEENNENKSDRIQLEMQAICEHMENLEALMSEDKTEVK